MQVMGDLKHILTTSCQMAMETILSMVGAIGMSQNVTVSGTMN